MLSQTGLVEFNPFDRQIAPSELLHFFLNFLQVALSNGFHRKVVVKAAVNGRSDGGQRTRVKFHHGLRQQVGCRVAKDVDALIGIGRNAFDGTVDVQNG